MFRGCSFRPEALLAALGPLRIALGGVLGARGPHLRLSCPQLHVLYRVLSQFGSLWGSPHPLEMTLPCRREREFSKIMTLLFDGLWRLSGIRFWTLWISLGGLLGLSSVLWGRPKPLLEHSWGAPGELFDTLSALLGCPWDRLSAPGPSRDRILEDLGPTGGSI